MDIKYNKLFTNINKMNIVSSKPTLTLATYNIQIFPWSSKDYKLFNKFALQYDVICFQEAYPNININQGRDKLIKYFSGKGYFCAYARTGYFTRHIIGSGLLIISKFPILKSSFTRYTHTSNIDTLSEKGFLHVTINHYGKIYEIINTHVQASYNTDEFIGGGLNQKSRMNQLNSMLKYVKLESLEYKPIIIAGDFNISTKEEIDWFSNMCNKINLKNRIIINYDGIITNISNMKQIEIPKNISKWSDHIPIGVIIQ